MNRLRIPLQIFNNEAYLKRFIRGLFDTDGSFTRHHKNSGAIVEISSGDKEFLKDISLALNKLKFKTNEGARGIKIYKKEHIERFFKIIKPSNPKHNLKYTTFKKQGFVLFTLELMKRVDSSMARR